MPGCLLSNNAQYSVFSGYILMENLIKRYEVVTSKRCRCFSNTESPRGKSLETGAPCDNTSSHANNGPHLALPNSNGSASVSRIHLNLNKAPGKYSAPLEAVFEL